MVLMRVVPPRPDLESNRDEAWFSRAACQGADRGLFFEPDHEKPKPRASRIRAAKAVCAECPVRRECLVFAMSTREPYGIWGGLTARERIVLRRRVPARTARRGDRRGP